MTTNSTIIPAILITDFYFSIVKTAVCIFSTITNAICIAVFLSPKMKDISFKYMLAQSISDFVYSFSLSFQILYYCPIDQIRLSLANQLYFLIIPWIVTSALAIFYILVAIWISLRSYLIFKNKKCLENISHKKIISFLLLFSFIYYFPAIFQNKIVPVNILNNSTKANETFYVSRKTDFANSIIGKTVYTFLEALRIFLNSIMLPFINVLILIESKNRFKKKFQLQAKHTDQGNKN